MPASLLEEEAVPELPAGDALRALAHPLPLLHLPPLLAPPLRMVALDRLLLLRHLPRDAQAPPRQDAPPGLHLLPVRVQDHLLCRRRRVRVDHAGLPGDPTARRPCRRRCGLRWDPAVFRAVLWDPLAGLLGDVHGPDGGVHGLREERPDAKACIRSDRVSHLPRRSELRLGARQLQHPVPGHKRGTHDGANSDALVRTLLPRFLRPRMDDRG
mmetsp:Transcript_30177/g.71788  ORF Transcript_30177/g.71788 Transcript_30177/m.71788 type:complete len:213 (+) Transcript_30177:247-885(+)